MHHLISKCSLSTHCGPGPGLVTEGGENERDCTPGLSISQLRGETDVRTGTDCTAMLWTPMCVVWAFSTEVCEAGRRRQGDFREGSGER